MMRLSVTAIPILSDNYAWLLRDAESGATAIVDPAEEAPIRAAIDAVGGRLDLILLTHHHPDHIDAVEPLRAHYRPQVVGARGDAHRLPSLDLALEDGDRVSLGAEAAVVIDTPGHTIGHIAYHFAESGILFCGDTLFSLGCGRLLEGSAEQMFASLAKFGAMADATLVCCGHEYTASNARFALAVDPDNAALQARATQVARLRAEGEATVPSLLGNERAENPFLRAPDAATFGMLRAQKDQF